VKLTDQKVRELPLPEAGNRVFYDDDVKGFGCRVTAKGARAFVVNYRTRDGRERRYTIGAYPDWKATAARTEAKRLKLAVDRGDHADPAGVALVALAIHAGLGETLADLGEGAEGGRVVFLDGASDRGGGDGHGLERSLAADALDGGEELVEPALGVGLKADETRAEGGAAADRLKGLHGRQRDLLPEARGEIAQEIGGQEDLVRQPARRRDEDGGAGELDEGSGEAGDHAAVSVSVGPSGRFREDSRGGYGVCGSLGAGPVGQPVQRA